MVGYTFTGLLGTGIPAFTTGITDLEVAWINGLPRLYSANLPGLGAGYAAFDLSGASGPAGLLAVQSYSNAVGHLRAPDFVVLPTTGGTANLVAGGPTPSGWASYGLTTGGFGVALNSALPFNPVATTGIALGGTTFVYFATQGATQPVAYRLADSGALTAVASAPVSSGGPEIDDLAVAQAAEGNFLLSVSASANTITTHSIGANGALAPAMQLSAQLGTGFSKPTEVATLALQGATYAIVAASESSSLSVFRILPGGVLHNTDHLVDGLMNRFQGATALAVLQQGARGCVAVGGADGGVDIMTLLPDGRLVSLMTITDSATMSLDHVSALSFVQSGGRTMLFATSATELGITQLDLALGTPGTVRWMEAGSVSGTSDDDILGAGATTIALFGGGGDDLIVGGGAGGAAELWGGSGADRFILSQSQATIVIRDFQAGVDRLDLSSFPMMRNLGQVSITTTATGALLTVMGTTIRIDSFDGNPIPATAFPLAHLVPVYRFPPDAGPLPPAQTVSGTAGNDLLNAAATGGALFGAAGDDSLVGAAGNDTLDGGDGNDAIAGWGGSDKIFAWGGNDYVLTGLGNDFADGGDGDDHVAADQGDDTLDGGTGQDTLLGDDGNDLIQGGAGQDSINGGAGRDTILGGSDDDRLLAGLGDDSVDGGDGNDYILTDGGNDTLLGQTGRDTLVGDDGDDLVYGGADDDAIAGLNGNDTLYGGAGSDILWDTGGNDQHYGDAGNDTLYGRDGNDLMKGGADHDWAYGGDGNDTAYGDDGDDYLLLGAGQDTAYGGAGQDSIAGEAGVDLLLGGDGNDVLAGQQGDDWLFGENGDDLLWDLEGTNNLFGGDGNDTLYGSGGPSLLEAGGGNDSVVGGSGGELVRCDDGDDQAMTYGGNDTVYGGMGRDTVGADSGDDLVFGGDGEDILWSYLGNDTFYGEAGNDLLWDDAGHDVLYGGAGSDTLWGGDGYDRLDGGSESDTLYGGAMVDLLYGGDGDDAVQGGAGTDWCFGGEGADRFIFASATDSPAWSGVDYIVDFVSGTDQIDVAALGLTWSGWGWSPGKRGLSVATYDQHLFVLADTNGDAVADFAVALLYASTFTQADVLF